jgi:hypothetical protein
LAALIEAATSTTPERRPTLALFTSQLTDWLAASREGGRGFQAPVAGLCATSALVRPTPRRSDEDLQDAALAAMAFSDMLPHDVPQQRDLASSSTRHVMNHVEFSAWAANPASRDTVVTASGRQS